jgi:hypothetical protein
MTHKEDEMRYLMMLFSLSIALVLVGCERSDAPEPAMEPQTVASEPAEPMVESPEVTEPPEAAEPAAPMDEVDTDVQSDAEQLWNRAAELAEEARDRAEEAWRVGQEEGGEAWEQAKDAAATARDRAEQAWDQAREFSGEAWEATETRTTSAWDEIKATWARMTESAEESEAATEALPNAVPAE